MADRARRERAVEPSPGVMVDSTVHVGNAHWIPFLILSAAFAVLSLSTLGVSAEGGLPVAIAIVCGLVTNFFLPPTLPMRLDWRGGATRG